MDLNSDEKKQYREWVGDSVLEEAPSAQRWDWIILEAGGPGVKVHPHESLFLLKKGCVAPARLHAGSSQWNKAHVANVRRVLPRKVRNEVHLYRQPVEDYLATLDPSLKRVLHLDTCSNRLCVVPLLTLVSCNLGPEGIVIVNVRAGHDGRHEIVWWRPVLGRGYELVSDPRPYRYYGSVPMRSFLLHYKKTGR